MGSAEKILQDLRWLGLDWEGDVLYQSARLNRYQSVLNTLSQQGMTYPCFCSRKDIQLAASAPHGKVGAYPGTCAKLCEPEIKQQRARKEPAIRLRVDPGSGVDCGDFVVKRADGLFAYQLAVVVDDIDQGVSEVVRGADLASSTARQRYLAKILEPDRSPIHYHHVPLLMDHRGNRMSKRDGSESVAQWQANGKTAPELIGQFSFQLGFTETTDPLSADQLLNQVDIRQLLAVFE